MAVGVCKVGGVTRLLARKLFLGKDGVDHVPGKHGYRDLTARFVAEVADYCADQGLGYFSIHNHGCSDKVSFSTADLESHRRGYPALVDLLGDQPMGALVFGTNVVAGAVWMKEGVFDLESFTVIGPAITKMLPKVACRTGYTPERYERQARIFGLKIVIIGLGGIGSCHAPTGAACPAITGSRPVVSPTRPRPKSNVRPKGTSMTMRFWRRACSRLAPWQRLRDPTIF